MTITLESLVLVPCERNELIQLLSFIAAEWHQDEEVLEQRSLADWPQWCEDQGFHFELLATLVLKLESTSQASANTPTIRQHIATLGANATVVQLLDRIAEHSPQLLQSFEELMEISVADAHALNTVAGGTAKECVKDHPGVVVASAGIATFITYKITRARQRVQRMERERLRDIENDNPHDGLPQDIEAETVDADFGLHDPQATAWHLQRVLNGAPSGPFQSAVSEEVTNYVDGKVEEGVEILIQKGGSDLRSRGGSVVDDVANEAKAGAESAFGNLKQSLVESTDNAVDNFVDHQISDAKEGLVDNVVDKAL